MKEALVRAPWLMGLMAALALGACGKADNDVKANARSQSSPPPQASSPATNPPTPPTSQMAQADTHADETAKGTDEPMKSMSNDEETKAMPQPGQANDHSTLAQDPKQPKEEK